MHKLWRYIIIFILFGTGTLPAQRFTAYYTKVEDNFPPTEKVDNELFGKYSDLIVEVEEKGKILFTRKTSYLPVWRTDDGKWNFDEIIERRGDGGGERPDMISRYSNVRIIQNDPEGIIIHWRYFPDFSNVGFDGAAEEYFEISRNGAVVRTVRNPCPKYDDWMTGRNEVVIKYRLNSGGIQEISRNPAKIRKIPNRMINISPVVQYSGDSVLRLSFDDAIDGSKPDSVFESIEKNSFAIAGQKAIWRAGVSGSALQFDGYYSAVKVDNPFKTDSISALTADAWFALQAYPFGWAPVVQQSEWGKKGFYLGINEDGFPGFHFEDGGKWISVVDSTRLELFKWYRIAGTFDKEQGVAELYLNGKNVAAKKVGRSALQLFCGQAAVGLNNVKIPYQEGRINIGKWPSMFGIEGLIDEVNIYDKFVDSSELNEVYSKVKTVAPDLPKKSMPEYSFSKGEAFYAEYTKLKYHEAWDDMWRVGNYADVVVGFDQFPAQIFFWRGTSYGPFFVTENGIWVGDQSNEDYRLIDHPGDAEGCLEHMSDKQCRHSNIRIIENTDARKVIHWRYGLVDSRYLFAPGEDGWGGWTDEYWTIYPDGVSVRNIARGIVYGDGWVETMFLSAPGTKPENNMEFQAYSFINNKGVKIDLSWSDESPSGIFDDPLVAMVNSKSKYKMFNIYPPGSSIEVFDGHSRRSHFHWWNHWPVSQITSDGRGARAADRIAHSSLVHGAPNGYFLLYGVTDSSLEKLLPLEKSWNNPPEIDRLEGATGARYVPEERAFHLYAESSKVSFYLLAADQTPAVNPAFVIHNWKEDKVEISFNGVRLPKDKNVRTGFVDTSKGRNLIVWLNKNILTEATIEFSSL